MVSNTWTVSISSAKARKAPSLEKRAEATAEPEADPDWKLSWNALSGEVTGRAVCDPTAVPEPEVVLAVAAPALDAEDLFGATALTAATAPTIRRLAGLEPRTLALMHGPAYAGDGRQALLDLAKAYEARFAASIPKAVA
jgi:hypothetical protein